MHVVMLDTETTSSKEAEAHIVEIGMVKIDTGLLNGNLEDAIIETFNKRVKPPVLIPFDAMAVHDITNEDVADCPSCSEIQLFVGDFMNGVEVIVCHNAPYDIPIVSREFPGIFESYRASSGSIICTLRISKHFDPEQEITSHALQALKYRLGLWGSVKKNVIPLMDTTGAHSALYDSLVDTSLFHHFVMRSRKDAGGDIDEVIHRLAALSHRPILLKRLTFGKHEGKTYQQVFRYIDPGYLKWLAKNFDDPDVVHTANYWISMGER